MPPRLTIRRITVATVAVAAALAIAVSEIATVQDIPVGTGNTANLWIDTNGGTCARQTLQVYNDAAACSSAQAAYTAASCGDTVRYRTGTSYGSASISTGTKNCSTGTRIIFRPEDNTPNITSRFNPWTVASSVRISAISVSKANCWCEFWDFDMYNDVAGHGIGDTNGNINIDLGPGTGAPVDGQVVVRRINTRRVFLRANDVEIRDSSIGGIDACADGDFGDQDLMNSTSGGNIGAGRIVVDGNRFHNTGGVSECQDHADAYQILDGHDIVISNNVVTEGPDEDFIARPFVDRLENITYENNMFAQTGGSQNIVVGDADGDPCSNIVFRNNSGTQSMNLRCSSGTGNLHRNNIASACLLIGATSSNNVGTSQSCGTGSRSCTPTYIDSSHASTGDKHLAAGDTCARGFGHASDFTATDFDGQSRPLGSASDIGADEIG